MNAQTPFEQAMAEYEERRRSSWQWWDQARWAAILFSFAMPFSIPTLWIVVTASVVLNVAVFFGWLAAERRLDREWKKLLRDAHPEVKFLDL